MTSQIKDPNTLWNKVPEVLISFWIIKIMATTVGETAADYLNTTLDIGLTNTSIIMWGLLLFFVTFQILSKKYIPALYWLTVVFMSIFGTLFTDNLIDNFGISLETTTLIFGATLTLIFGLWYMKEKTLSIHAIVNRKREVFYWIAILFTFALGTASGDLFAEWLSLGYLTSAMIFAGIIALIAGVHYIFRVNSILCFWLAYILTRPLGASLWDYLSQTPGDGWLGLGTTSTSILFLTIITVIIIVLSLRLSEYREAPPLI
jgi:uncharacterized membrane-anchored protein